jgi:hypothetical protein
METLPSDAEARSSPEWSVASQERRQPNTQLISASLTLTEFREVTDSDFELIEMRYQQLLALMNLEPLFADGQLDCM